MDAKNEIQEKVNNLPTSPGVYLWKDDYGRIIYVGKAINLRNRVRSYVRQDANRAPKVTAMMRRAVDLDIILTASEMEALILENTLIKEHKPKYNILLRDDKTYPYIKVTASDYPQVLITRRVLRDGGHYFGPFTDAGAVHQTLKTLRQLFPLRTCRSMKVNRPCLQYHMNRCLAPCMNYVTKEVYGMMIHDVLAFLEGRNGDIVCRLKNAMEQAAEQLDFERAAVLRDQMQALEKVQERQNMVAAGGDMDILGLAHSATLSCVQIFMVRGGKLLGRDNFILDNGDGEDDASNIAAVLNQYYGEGAFIPNEIIVPALENPSLYEKWFTDSKGRQVSIIIPQRGTKRGLLTMAMENAANLLEQKKLQWQQDAAKTGGAVQALAMALELPRLPERMECFDISHIQGSETVASMVVFQGGRPAKGEYRRFKLKTVEGKPDDFASMAEVMERRYSEKDWPLPDLIVVDGGKGQLHAALPIIRQAGVAEVPVISLAKRLEEVFIEGETEPILLNLRSPELQLLQQLRDEAHRFAITYHRRLRGKRNLESVLDHVPGIGAGRRNALWHTFKSLGAMKNATVEELIAVKGMNRQAAENVYHFFRLERDEKRKITGIF